MGRLFGPIIYSRQILRCCCCPLDRRIRTMRLYSSGQTAQPENIVSAATLLPVMAKLNMCRLKNCLLVRISAKTSLLPQVSSFQNSILPTGNLPLETEIWKSRSSLSLVAQQDRNSMAIMLAKSMCRKLFPRVANF